jgi:hypothetical protein
MRELSGVAYRRTIMWKLIVIAPVVLLFGCASDESAVDLSQLNRPAEEITTGQTDPPVPTNDVVPVDSASVVEDDAIDGPLMRHPTRSDVEEGTAAEVRGVLELADGCLYLSIDEIDERYPVLWPAQTEWVDEREAVVLPTGDEIAVGGLAYGGGGYYYVDDIDVIAGPQLQTSQGSAWTTPTVRSPSSTTTTWQSLLAELDRPARF